MVPLLRFSGSPPGFRSYPDRRSHEGQFRTTGTRPAGCPVPFWPPAGRETRPVRHRPPAVPWSTIPSRAAADLPRKASRFRGPSSSADQRPHSHSDARRTGRGQGAARPCRRVVPWPPEGLVRPGSSRFSSGPATRAYSKGRRFRGSGRRPPRVVFPRPRHGSVRRGSLTDKREVVPSKGLPRPLGGGLFPLLSNLDGPGFAADS